jgi:N,N-dimethylformamidase
MGRINKMPLCGYADPMVIKAGGKVEFKISGDEGLAEIQLVRLIHGDTGQAGPGFVEKEVSTTLPGKCAVHHQPTHFGSYAQVSGVGPLQNMSDEGTVYAFICPTRPGAGEQTIVGCLDSDNRRGYRLCLDADGVLTFQWGQAGECKEIKLDAPVVANCWYFVAASWSRHAQMAALHQIGVVSASNSIVSDVVGFDLDGHAVLSADMSVDPSACAFMIAACHGKDGGIAGLFDGKIDRPGVQSRALTRDQIIALSQGAVPDSADIVARWDTSAGYDKRGIGDVIQDVGPHGLHAIGVNRPVRGMTGWNWDGTCDSFRIDPGQYGGVAFHSDALIDCGWATNVTFEVPEALRSGAYALRVRIGDEEDHISFFVTASRPTGRVAVLLSTFTYLAYANESMPVGNEVFTGVPLVMSEREAAARAGRQHGLSTYDTHVDGAGVCFSSWRRPIRNMRPRFRMESLRTAWAFPADLSLIWWLEKAGFDYEVVTDHDLDAEGDATLLPYRCVITSTHPEYYSLRMLDGLTQYINAGGRVVYLGGNGFYWVCEARESEPWCVEVRRNNTGIRAWQGRCGEGYMVTTGERGGLWRDRGRPPQKMVGVGFTTEGMDESRPFERLSDSFAPEVSWMFNGIGRDELIGDFGLGLGGASGLEMDRYDLALGTPPHTRLLCASFGHSDAYTLVPEDIQIMMPGLGGTQSPLVRGDVTFFDTRNGGAVFAAGSIAWSQALPINNGDNNVATITRNVIDAFIGNTDHLVKQRP